jgi:steroid delta-isomerase-like uncharacterized protein
MPLTAAGLRSKREEIVREHMDSENRHEFDATLDTFGHPRYEIVPTGDVYDGAEEVMAYYEETRKAFPDQRNELISLRHSEDAVIVEANLLGTHEGPFRGLPPTGKSFEMPFVAFFVFEGDQLVNERVYFNAGTILEALGIQRSPLSVTGKLETVVGHPLTIGRALVRRVTGR